jgi:endonuclease YncB( thermonuclease family)
MAQEPWGGRSREHLRSVTPRRVILIPKSTRYGFKDRFGRTVGEVLAQDESRRNLNIAQVFSGSAAVYPRYCRDDRYFWTEQVARSAKSGIWASRGLHQTPWRTRH